MKTYASIGTRIIIFIIVAACLAGVVFAVPRLAAPGEQTNGIDPEQSINVGSLSISYKKLTELSSQAKNLTNQNLQPEELPKVGSMVELLRMFDEMGLFYSTDSVTNSTNEFIMKSSGAMAGGIMEDGLARVESVETATANQAAPAAEPPMATAAPADTGGYSETNTQVSGVDEGDMVKTDGEYIYYAGYNRIAIVKADGADMKRESIIQFNENVNFSEMYVTDKYLVAVVNRYEAYDMPDGPIGIMPYQNTRIAPDIAIWRPGKSFTSFIVYDISDKTAPKEVRRVEAEGGSISTRMVGNTIYFVTNKWISPMPYIDSEPFDILPAYRDTAASNDAKSIEPADISYFPGTTESTYMLVGAFNVDDMTPCEPEAFLGSGSTIYMSLDSLYVVRQVWENEKNSLIVYRFAIDGTNVNFINSGRVDGNILNQYSMDEYNGYFRIATTLWQNGKNVNNLFILDNKTMAVTGSVTGLARGESIKSVRFMGDTGYIVTFEQIDPLFVIDLKDPSMPRVLGELKIPGFSQYLHPFGDGILIGIGRDTQEMYVRDEYGVETVVGTRDAGLKLSMFDVSDPVSPKEIHKFKMGTMSTYTEVSNNPRALMVDTQKGILAMPIQDYSDSQFTGAAVISADKNDGFKLLSKLKAEKEYGEFSWQTRVCYIGNTLYMASGDYLTAYDYESYKQLGSALNAMN